MWGRHVKTGRQAACEPGNHATHTPPSVPQPSSCCTFTGVAEEASWGVRKTGYPGGRVGTSPTCANTDFTGFFCLFYSHTLGICKFPGWGSNWSCSCNYTTATAMRDRSHIFNLHHGSWQCCILNPLSEARDQIHILMDTSQDEPTEPLLQWGAAVGIPSSIFHT